MFGSDVPTTGDLERGGQIRLHHSQRFLVLRNVVRERARDRILQEPFVGNQAVAVDRLHLRRVKIHGHHADQYEHT